MTIFLLATRLTLAAILLTAAGGKLLDRPGARDAMRDFGVPARLARPAALLLPVAEIAIAGALIPPVSGWYGAIGALVLLAAFSAAIALSIARGRAPDCHCFGQLGGGPVDLGTLARNAGFAAIALVAIAAGPDQDGYSWATDLSAAEQIALGSAATAIVLGALLLALIVVLVPRLQALTRRVDTLERNAPPPGLPIGLPAPNFALPAVSRVTAPPLEAAPTTNEAAPAPGTPPTPKSPEGVEGAVTLEALRALERPVLLTFTDPNCVPCGDLYPDLAAWQRDHSDTLTVALIASGEPTANRVRAMQHKLANVLVQHDDEVATTYRSPGTPSAVLVSPDGTIASALALGADEIRELTDPLRVSTTSEA